MDNSEQFDAALARLDAEIRDAEGRLADLRLKRTGAQFFLEYLNLPLNSSKEEVPRSTTAAGTPQVSGDDSTSPKDAVVAAMNNIESREFRIDDLYALIVESGAEVNRAQTQNSIHYMVRRKELVKVRRGVYTRPTNTEAPAVTGASVSDQSTDDWSWKEGGIREDDTEPLRDHNHHPATGDEDSGHDLRAAIEVASEV